MQHFRLQTGRASATVAFLIIEFTATVNSAWAVEETNTAATLANDAQVSSQAATDTSAASESSEPGETAAEKAGATETDGAAGEIQPTTASDNTGAETAPIVEATSDPVQDQAGTVVDAPPAEEKKEKSWTDHFSLKGDFRYRFETIDITDTDDSKVRYRHRIRGRLGIDAKMAYGFKVGFQLATGSDDPVSTNQTLTNAFSTKPLWIDLAYLSFEPDYLKGLSLFAGKMKNPFRQAQKTELVWDGDLNPEGIALGYEGDFGIAAPFLQTGGFFVEERKGEKDSWLLGVQAGLKLTFADGIIYLLAAGGYFDHTQIKGSTVYFDPEDGFGNSTELAAPDDAESAELAYLYDYNLVEGIFELGGKIGRFPWAAFGSVVKNVAEDVDDDFGWLVGVTFGKCKKALDFDLKYTYRLLESDAVLGLFTDSDFIGGGTNGRGHEWNLGFQALDAMKIAASLFYNQMPAHDEDDVKTDDYLRFQLDFEFKF